MAVIKKYNPIDLLPDVAIGVKIPLVGKSGILFDQSYSTEDQVLSNLKSLILTRKGERVMQPTLGAEIQDSLFEQNTDTLKRRIETSIVKAIDFWLPYIDIIKLDVNAVVAVGPGTEEHGVTISIVVSLNGSESEKTVTFLATPTLITLS